MAKESQKTSLAVRAGKLVGDQIVSSVFSFAFGSTFVMGGVAAVAGVLQGVPLMWLIFAVTGVMAFTSVALNNVRKYAMSTSVAEKFQWAGIHVGSAENAEKGHKGNGVGIDFVNLSDVPLQFRLERSHVHLDGRVPVAGDQEIEGVLAANTPGGMMLGLVLGDLPANKNVKGGIECEVSYGRVGKRQHRREYKFRLAVITGPGGIVLSVTPYAN